MFTGFIKYFVGLFMIQYHKIALIKKVSLGCYPNKTKEYNTDNENVSIYENDWSEGEVTWDIYKKQAQQELLQVKPNIHHLINEFLQ